jgi:hypothetical protein
VSPCAPVGHDRFFGNFSMSGVELRDRESPIIGP